MGVGAGGKVGQSCSDGKGDGEAGAAHSRRFDLALDLGYEAIDQLQAEGGGSAQIEFGGEIDAISSAMARRWP